MNRRMYLFIVMAVVAILVMGVGGATAQDNARLRIGLVQLGTDNPFWIAQVEGGQEAARRYGFELVVTSGEGKVDQQVAAFEDLVNQGVNAISVNPLDVQAFGQAMQKAADANIPVVCLFSMIDGCVTVLGVEERTNGGLVGQYAVKLLTDKYGSPKGNIAILLGALGQTGID